MRRRTLVGLYYVHVADSFSEPALDKRRITWQCLSPLSIHHVRCRSAKLTKRVHRRPQ